MKKIMYCCIIMAFLFVSCDKNNSNETIIKIGAIFPFASNAYVNGECMKAALNEATTKLNTESNDVNFEFVMINNDQNDALTISALQELDSQGIKHVVAALSSYDLNAAKTYADANEMYIVNQTSTAPYLAEEDNIYRIIPSDKQTAPAIAKAMNNEGIKKVITVYRDDIWGASLASELEISLANYQIEQLALLPYSGRSGSDAFDDLLSQISSSVSDLVADEFNNEIAIQVISFSEGIDLIEKAADVDKLNLVRWFGSDGFSFNPDVENNKKVAQFMIQTKFLSPLFAESNTEEYNTLKAAIEQKSGMTANSFALLYYDAAMLTGQTLEAIYGTSTNFGTALLNQISNGGTVCGDFGLDAAGDRITSADYDFWGIEKNGQEYKWTKIISSVSSD